MNRSWASLLLLLVISTAAGSKVLATPDRERITTEVQETTEARETTEAQPSASISVEETSVGETLDSEPEGLPSKIVSPQRSVISGRSLSTGWPWRGRLLAPAELRESDVVHLIDEDKAAGCFFGTDNLVSLVVDVASRVAETTPSGTRLNVGELSCARGGNIRGHRSHENGRDVDIGFYYVDEHGNAVEPTQFVQVGRRGTGVLDEQVLRFDDERNWRLIEALLTSDAAAVQYIFVSRRIKKRVLRAGKRLGANDDVIARADRAIVPPLGSSHPHRNHFHVRVYCDANDVPACRDRGPVWPWIDSEHPFYKNNEDFRRLRIIPPVAVYGETSRGS